MAPTAADQGIDSNAAAVMNPKLMFACLAVAVVLMGLAVFHLQTAPQVPAPPLARDGKLNVGGWNFATNGPVELRGDWGFAWREFIDPNLEQAPTETMALPAKWNQRKHRGSQLPGRGYASFYLQIHLPRTEPGAAARPLGLYIRSFYKAGTLWVNGRRAANFGTPGTSRANELPHEEVTVVALPTTEQVHLVFHVSSFHHIDGGLHTPILLGDLNDLQQKNSRRQVRNWIAIGGALGVALYLLGIYLGRPSDRVYLYAAGTLCALAVRLFGVEKVGLMVAPSLSPFFLQRCEYWGWFGLLGCYLGFYSTLYPKEMYKRINQGLAVIIVAGLVAVLVLPTWLSPYMRDPGMLLSLAIQLYFIFVLFRAVQHDHPGVWVVSSLSLVTSVMLSHDLFMYLGWAPNINWIHWSDYSLLVIAPGTVAALILRINRTTRAEVRLTRELQTMNVELQQRVEGRTHELASKVKELEALQTEADAARREAETANQNKSNFLAIMAHEIRTPLSGIQGSLDLVRNETLSTESKQLLDNARESNRALLDIVNDALDVAAIDAGRLELKPRTFALVPWLEQIRNLMALPIKEKQLQFNFELSNYSNRIAEEIVVEADQGRLRQVLVNLINNACKFTDRGNVSFLVDIKNADDDDPNSKLCCEFFIKDTGSGISVEEQTKIFQRFHQVDSSAARQHSGTGLGLSIAAQIVQSMGSELRVASELGKGSCFSFSLELPLAQPLPAVIASAAKNSSQLTNNKAQRQPIPLNILLVEDDKSNSDVLTILLQRLGHNTQACDNGADALALFVTQKFDVILTDIRLPRMSGLELLQKVRELPKGDLPVIAVTANVSETDLEFYRAQGMDAVLAKPVDFNQLDAVLNKICEGAALSFYKEAKEQYAHDSTTKFKPDNLILLKNTLGESALLGRLTEFKQKRGHNAQAMIDCWRGNDWKTLESLCHKLIGNCGYQGLAALADYLKQLQTAIHNKNAEEIDRLMSKLKNKIREADTQLEQWLQTETDVATASN